MSRLLWMPAGDSITVGTGDTVPGGWRAGVVRGKLWDGLPWRSCGLTLTTTLGEGRMCGTNGLTVAEIADALALQAPLWLNDPTRTSIVDLTAGTNDTTQLATGGTPTVATSMTNYTALLDALFATRVTTVFVGLPVYHSTYPTGISTFNASLNPLLLARSEYTSGRLRIVDLYTTLGTDAANFDSPGHPGVVGNALCATAWNTAHTAAGY